VVIKGTNKTYNVVNNQCTSSKMFPGDEYMYMAIGGHVPHVPLNTPLTLAADAKWWTE